jgi:acyl-CoA synthetase (AMP-forming)/AMP-acid ligase II
LTADPKTLPDLLRFRALRDPDGTAYTFLTGSTAGIYSITWSELDARATGHGSLLRGRGAVGKPVLLALPSGLAFVEWLFGCWYAGAIAVPVGLPRHLRVKHRLEVIMTHSGANFVVTKAAVIERLESGHIAAPDVGTVHWIDAEASAVAEVPDTEPEAYASSPQGIALLQYTSGSTGTPRGVVVTHANLMCNNALIAEACEHGPGQTIGGWLPLFHDMGLIGLVMQAAFSGARCVFMSPETFLMRPRLWLKMISDYRVCSSPAPNFAYDLCVDRIAPQDKSGLDLGCWRNALNGSEPIRAMTLERFVGAFSSCGFRPEAFFPCYGLAEATLFATGPVRGGSMRRRTESTSDSVNLRGRVGCGGTYGDTQLAIVDPVALVRVPTNAVGEIWLAGGSIAAGYWNDPQATAATFGAVLGDGNASGGTEQKWLRTGDLGFLADDDLFITGRSRELIIVAGRNHFPIDIEHAVELADPAVAPTGAVAFSVAVDGIERLVVAAEIRESRCRPSGTAAGVIDVEATRRRIAAAVAAENEVAPYEVVLLSAGTISRTSSGKVSRLATRDAYLNRTLKPLESAPDVSLT